MSERGEKGGGGEGSEGGRERGETAQEGLIMALLARVQY